MFNRIFAGLVAATLTVLFISLTATAQGAVDDALTKLQQEVAQLAKAVDDKQSELLNVDKQLEQSSREIIAAYQRLNLAQKELNNQQEIFNSRIREVYKNNNNYNFIALLLTSENFNDFWNRVAFLARLNEVDRNLLAENKRRLSDVQSIKKEITERKNAQIEFRRQKQKELADLSRAFLEKQAQLIRMRASLQNKAKEQSTFVSEFSLTGLGKR